MIAHSLCKPRALHVDDFALLAGDCTPIEPVLLLLLRASKHHLRPTESLLCLLRLLPSAEVKLCLDPIDLLTSLLLTQLDLLDLPKLLAKLEKESSIL